MSLWEGTANSSASLRRSRLHTSHTCFHEANEEEDREVRDQKGLEGSHVKPRWSRRTERRVRGPGNGRGSETKTDGRNQVGAQNRRASGAQAKVRIS